MDGTKPRRRLNEGKLHAYVGGGGGDDDDGIVRMKRRQVAGSVDGQLFPSNPGNQTAVVA